MSHSPPNNPSSTCDISSVMSQNKECIEDVLCAGGEAGTTKEAPVLM